MLAYKPRIRRVGTGWIFARGRRYVKGVQTKNILNFLITFHFLVALLSFVAPHVIGAQVEVVMMRLSTVAVTILLKCNVKLTLYNYTNTQCNTKIVNRKFVDVLTVCLCLVFRLNGID